MKRIYILLVLTAQVSIAMCDLQLDEKYYAHDEENILDLFDNHIKPLDFQNL